MKYRNRLNLFLAEINVPIGLLNGLSVHYQEIWFRKNVFVVGYGSCVKLMENDLE